MEEKKKIKRGRLSKLLNGENIKEDKPIKKQEDVPICDRHIDGA